MNLTTAICPEAEFRVQCHHRSDVDMFDSVFQSRAVDMILDTVITGYK